MTEITLTIEQAEALSGSPGIVLVYYPDGTSAGLLDRSVRVEAPAECTFTPEEIEAALEDAKKPGPRHTTAEVMARLRQS